MRPLLLRLGLAALLCGCSSPTRDNPDDPVTGGDDGIELIADLPAGGGATGDLLSEIRYTVSSEDMADSVSGTMNLVGTQARGLVKGVTAGLARQFRVEVFDANRIRTFEAVDTVDVANSAPLTIRMSLARLTGNLELTSRLPPEIVSLQVAVVIGGDTTAILSFEVGSEGLLERIQGIPTGTGIKLVMWGIDDDDQVLVSEMNNGQLVKVLRAEYLTPAQALNKVNGQPFKISEIEDAIKGCLDGQSGEAK